MGGSSEQIAREFAEKVRQKAPDQIRGIFFYGSRARGDEEPDSDYDVLIVVEEESRELEDRILDVAVEFLDRYDALISPMLTTVHNFRYYRDAGIYREVLRQGVRL